MQFVGRAAASSSSSSSTAPPSTLAARKPRTWKKWLKRGTKTPAGWRHNLRRMSELVDNFDEIPDDWHKDRKVSKKNLIEMFNSTP